MLILKKVFISSDHAGVKLRLVINSYLQSLGCAVKDYGCVIHDAIVDYPDYVKDVVYYVSHDEQSCGILICGTGIGMSIAANRYKKIRAALCHSIMFAKLAREHNNANVLCLGSRYTNDDDAKAITYQFLITEFSSGRHAERIKKLENYDNN
ncbi:ribose 5-phosphate isomerase B [Candidatus Neoehrlichia procyonis]|uniref:Ribose 5-phosphate isomerase B n=1 Tax=Candidatus Neoehrlichia procyonis str. RAC413 TaxID=1359163 RepID=A0A0F3NM56_9RICK|nr:ribose 5-phosphate isomerase B [Candidatus Neoehrlichia lotoris]KJV68866.1 ribose 5-phosphate isomerase B [Candidatus Neoehrlichia lotoris str. RAC413]